MVFGLTHGQLKLNSYVDTLTESQMYRKTTGIVNALMSAGQ
jgi:hypothetical protein